MKELHAEALSVLQACADLPSAGEPTSFTWKDCHWQLSLGDTRGRFRYSGTNSAQMLILFWKDKA